MAASLRCPSLHMTDPVAAPAPALPAPVLAVGGAPPLRRRLRAVLPGLRG